VLAALVATSLAATLFFEGAYDYVEWAPLALGAYAAVAAVLLLHAPSLTRAGLVAVCSFGLLTAWAGLSTTWAASVERAWTEADRFGLYLALLVLGLAVGRSAGAARLLLGIFSIAVALTAGYLLARMLTGHGEGLFLTLRLNQPMGYANAQAGLLLMGFWSLLAWAEAPGRLVRRVPAAALAVAVACLLVLTQSRAILPAAAVTLVVLAVLAGRERRAWLLVCVAVAVTVAVPALLDVYEQRSTGAAQPSDDVLRSAALATLGAAALAAVAWGAVLALAGSAARAQRVRNSSRVVLGLLVAALLAGGVVAIGNPVDAARNGWEQFTALEQREGGAQRFTDLGGYRYDHWRIALGQFQDHPLKGLGAGNYVSTYYLERRTGDYVRQPHSLELQILAELGLVGALLLLAFLGAVAWAAWRPPARSAAADRVVRPAALGIFVVWVAHTSVDWLFNIPGLTGYAFVAAGVLLAKPLADGARGRVSPVAIAALLCVAMLAAAVGRHYGAALYRDRSAAELAAAPAEALADAERALALDPHDVDAYIVAAAAHARANRYAKARAALLEAARREPFNYVPWALLGDLATRRGDLEQARRDYARAKALNPYDPLIEPAPGS
jgi:tetratricopeptide (TPR) repeat protein